MHSPINGTNTGPRCSSTNSIEWCIYFPKTTIPSSKKAKQTSKNRVKNGDGVGVGEIFFMIETDRARRDLSILKVSVLGPVGKRIH